MSKKGVAVNFNRHLYSLKAIKAAEKAYAGLADFSVASDKKYIRVEIKNVKPEVAQNFEAEFSNYVLGLTAAEIS